jgi:hypothetical protein
MLINIWTAKKTLPLQLAVRLIAGLRATGRECSYRVHLGETVFVTVTFTMASAS